jgi:glycosyltransferase involved in cell wall biosynthesis
MARRRVPLSIVIPVLDEGDRIGDCVRQLAWADEVLVADGGSRDDTVPAARAAGATVLEGTGPTIAAQRNAAIALARNHWVFALDADERIPDPLRDELAAVIEAPSHPVYRVRRQNVYLGRELTHGRWGKDWVIRLFTRERRYVERRVHEGLEPVAGAGSLAAPLLHVPYRDLGHQLAKMNRYARWGAQDLFEQGKRAGLWDLAARPLGRFARAYLLDGGWRDGRFGFVTSVLGCYTAFLKYAHLWDLERSGREKS